MLVLGSRECGELAVAGGLADEARSLEGREWVGFFVDGLYTSRIVHMGNRGYFRSRNVQLLLPYS